MGIILANGIKRRNRLAVRDNRHHVGGVRRHHSDTPIGRGGNPLATMPQKVVVIRQFEGYLAVHRLQRSRPSDDKTTRPKKVHIRIRDNLSVDSQRRNARRIQVFVRQSMETELATGTSNRRGENQRLKKRRAVVYHILELR